MDNTERKFKAACVLIDFKAGSLWQVREDLWKQSLSGYGEKSTRTWHPALSVLARPLSGLYDRVPVFHGSSGTYGPVVVRGITEEKGEEHPTSFGYLLANLSMREWTDEVPGADRNQLTGDKFARKRVLPNWHKPRVTEPEYAKLVAWMKRRGML